MFKNKRILTVLICVLITVFIAGCGGKTSESADDKVVNDNNKSDSVESDSESDYPNGPIDMIVGFGAGGGTDNFTRAIAKELEDILGTKINVINKPGSAGAVATEYVVNQPADGYTIFAVPDHTVTVAVGANDYGLDYLRPVARIQKDTMTVQALSEKYSNMDELIKAAEENPNTIKIGGTGSAGIDEIAFRKLEQALGVEMNYVTYEEAGDMHAALLGGHIDAIMEELGPTIAHIDSGSISVLVVLNEERLEAFPDVPSTVELGWDDLTDGMPRGIIVHSDTPDEVVAILESALKEAKDRPDYLEYEKNNYLHLNDGWLNSEDFRKSMEEEIEVYSKIANELN